jgi:hypothetical protein
MGSPCFFYQRENMAYIGSSTAGSAVGSQFGPIGAMLARQLGARILNDDSVLVIQARTEEDR